ncbi:MAG TPA: response regulator transcription factor [Rhodocyclaceae bacterium]
MRILLVEDDNELSDAMSAALREDGYVVDVAATKKSALIALDSVGYDLAVLDIGLPDGTGFEIVHYMRQRNSAVPVLILTARDALDDKVRGLDLGADDYLVKPIALKEMSARARALIRRGHCGSGPLLRAGGLELDTVGRQAHYQGQAVPLTAREWGALEYLAARAGRIVAKEQLLQALCGWDRDVTINAVEMTVHRLRTKVEDYGVNIRTVRGLGYLLDRDE